MARIGMKAAFSIVVTIVALSAFATATEYIVGDDSGWTTGFDYTVWAEGKKFRVGDTLVFNYNEGDHTVVKVNGTGFANCIKSPNLGVLASGSDRITLTTTGNKWYICGVGSHCEVYYQKLKITVLPKMMLGSPAPAPYFSVGSHGPKWAAPAPAPSFQWEPLIPTTPVMPPMVETPGSGWASEGSHSPKWAAPAPAPDTSFSWAPWLSNTPVMPPTAETPGYGWASEGSHGPQWAPPAPAPDTSFPWEPLIPTTPVMPPMVETPGSGWASEGSHSPKWVAPAPAPDASFSWAPLLSNTPVMPPTAETPGYGWASEGSHGPKWAPPAPAPDTSFPWEPLIPTTPVMPPMVETPGYGWASEEKPMTPGSEDPKSAEEAPAPTPWVPSPLSSHAFPPVASSPWIWRAPSPPV